MSDEEKIRNNPVESAGALLKAARETHELSLREVADRLHLMPGYPAIIEADEFQSLRHPAFARGYVKAYGKLLDVDETQLLSAFDRTQAEAESPAPKKVRTPPLQLQRTGLGVVIGLLLLALLVTAIWWWRVVPETDVQALEIPAAEGSSAGLDSDFSTTGDT